MLKNTLKIASYLAVAPIVAGALAYLFGPISIIFAPAIGIWLGFASLRWADAVVSTGETI